MYKLMQSMENHPIMSIVTFLFCMGVTFYTHQIPQTPLIETIALVSLIATILIGILAVLTFMFADDIND